ncbi:MAG: twin transmembrane helix small protein [Azospirillum brasilense]|nr:MAG: twin transmembrane helix small protein [Azospirillum brasilense]
MTGLAILLLALMGATAVVLVVGIVLMARGGEPNRKYGNKMMVARVTLQGLALGAMALMLLARQQGA